MYILGIHFSSHDTSACLLRDGKIIGFIEEERLNRIKHTIEFPSQAIDTLLKSEGISLDQVDYVAIPTTHSTPFGKLLRFISNFDLRWTILMIAMSFKYQFKYTRTLQRFKRRLNKDRTEVIFVEHHTAHMANAFLVSPFKNAAILSIDGGGDGLTNRLAYGEENKIQNITSASLPHSIGFLYYLVSHYLGFASAGAEGKVMGLSSYGDPDSYIDLFRDIVQFKDNGIYTLNRQYLTMRPSGFLSGSVDVSDYFIKRFGPPRVKGKPISKRHENIAASLQKITEETVAHVLNHLHNTTKCDNLVLGGGVALNSVMNGKLHHLTPFKNIFVQPLSYDGGNAAGAALYTWNVILGRPRQYQLDTCYLGPEFSSNNILQSLKEAKLNFEILEDPSRRAAELVADGKIIGWFQGKMEAGARALGNRSILADPRAVDMKDTINARVKHREPFRPFAPAILEERMTEYFEDSIPVPFMERVFRIRPDKRNLIPAVTHIDGTGRLQTVNEKSNQKFYRLIKEFHRITNVPVVLNTSFNIRGEPIICSPSDAIRCFYTTGIDYLIIDKFLLSK